MEITYHQEGGYLLLNLSVPSMPPMGKYARLRLRHLKEYRPALYTSLLLTGKLDNHLSGVETSAQAMMETIVSRLKQEHGITETLKATDQMRWVAEIGNIRASAEETVLKSLIRQ